MHKCFIKGGLNPANYQSHLQVTLANIRIACEIRVLVLGCASPGGTGNQPRPSGSSHRVRPDKACVCALVSSAYLSPPGPVVSPRWTPVFGCCSSTFSHQLFCTLTTQGGAMIQPWRQELPRGPAVGASWKLKAGPCQEACLSFVREERDGPRLSH